jgi:hypothetical protein
MNTIHTRRVQQRKYYSASAHLFPTAKKENHSYRYSFVQVHSVIAIPAEGYS